jgi:DNA-binding NtrC family response regulator
LSTPASKILVVSHDPSLADVRKAVLERAGFKVISAKSDSEISDICKKKKPRLVMIGYSLTPAAKRRVWDEARKTCKVPILELHKGRGPELMPPAYFHEAQTPDDFLTTVQKVLKELNN